jgi:glycosyltransferase involved in cell wall biosynthesis
VNAPDHHRIRISLPYFEEFGWKATVLAVNTQFIEGAVLDPLLEKTIPGDVDIIRVGAISAALTRMVGLGNFALRALPNLWRTGNRLLSGGDRGQRPRLQSGKLELVYFSTTQFPATILGPIWKRKFGIPYVVDFQDPWLDDYYQRTGTPPPGGKAKHGLSQRLARLLEPRVMRGVSEVISVSPAYVETLLRRYPFLQPDQFTVLPFGAAESDFELVNSLNLPQTLFDLKDGKQHWVYVGRGGRDMWPALRLLFSGLAATIQRDPDIRSTLRLHFVGTSYAPAERAEKSVAPIAAEFGVGELVEERTGRIPYFEALRALQDADALLLVSSDSPSYSASKLYPYMFARKPLLAVLHRASLLVQVLRQCKAGEIFAFDPNIRDDKSVAEMAQALQRIYTMAEKKIAPDIDETELRKYTGREMTRKQCEIFNRAVELSRWP